MPDFKRFLCRLVVPELETEIEAECWYAAKQHAAPRLINRVIRDYFDYIDCEKV